jgi:hypothetical protein
VIDLEEYRCLKLRPKLDRHLRPTCGFRSCARTA